MSGSVAGGVPAHVGQRVPRLIDDRLLRGGGRYIDDLDVPGALHAAIVRSPVAHGTIRRFDASAVEDRAVLVLGPDELAARAHPLPVVWKLGDQTMLHTPLVSSHVRYVGQPIGIVVAQSRYAAEDAAERIVVDIDELPVVADIDAALADGAPVLHPERGSNVLATFGAGDPPDAADAVLARCHHRLRTTLTTGRVSGIPLEPRGILADAPIGGKLTIWTSTQAAHAVRDVVSEVTGLPQHRVRVITPDVGGGFGLKDHIYEDELMVVFAALELGRPVKWIEDRAEAMVATTHARDERFAVEVGFDDDGTLRALKIEAWRNAGAQFAIFGGGPLFTALGMAPGQYRWEAVSGTGHLVATNRVPTAAYRGFGQTQAAFVRERVVDLVAAQLGRDPVDLRLQNMLGADELPFTSRTFVTYDNGDYPASLRRARELIEADELAADDGRARGIGYACYVQLAGVGPSAVNEILGLSIGGFETAQVRMERDASVRVYTGVSPHGQGHETTFAQLVADRLGVGLDQIELVFGDTDSAPYSAYGTAASRSIAVGGGAAVTASERLATKLRTIAAHLLEANPDDIVLAGGRAGVIGTNVSVSLVDVAVKAHQGMGLPEGTGPGLTESFVYDPVSATFSYATHACRVAVDRDTGIVDVERYVVVNDCGTMVNPTIVEGQIHGGIAQGLGAALLEEIVYDEQGQPLTTTFLDYLAPVSASMPDVVVEHMEIPSPYTPGGMKGMGEGGTNGAFACVVNAVAAALPEVASAVCTTPLSPTRLWTLLHAPGES